MGVVPAAGPSSKVEHDLMIGKRQASRIGFYANLQSAGKNQPPKHG
jgi:hypothetical protein